MQAGTSPSVRPWDLKVQFLKGVGDKIAKLFAHGDIYTLWDLFLFLPRTYEDRRHFSNFDEIEQASLTQSMVIGRGWIDRYNHRPVGGGRKRVLEAVLRMEKNNALSPYINFTWFNDFGGSLMNRFPAGSEVIFRGKVQGFRGALQIVHPDLLDANTVLPEWEFGAYVPVYREIGGLSTKVIRKMIFYAFGRKEFLAIPELLPRSLLDRYSLPTFRESLKEIHFPKKWEPSGADLRADGIYFRRIVFEELFMMALALHLRKAQWRAESAREVDRIPEIKYSEAKLSQEIKKLPYTLTGDQQKSLNDILQDLSLSKDRSPMHRLVQGDVGSGKTIVAFLSALAAMDAGFQVAYMAPTEILADQHYQNFSKFFPEHSHLAYLLKGALTLKNKKEVRAKVESGEARFVIGTQALLTEDTLFEKLGLIIVDEQHRFGVEQRLGLKRQSAKLWPHLLVMTATPIPRSLALSLYGDLSMSVIREKPPGRTPIRTHIVKQRAYAALKERLQKFLDEGRQIYIVYPLVEESEELDLKDVQNAFKEWSQTFGENQVGLLHGRLKSKDKEQVMRDFKDGKIKVLVSTTVIEVGVDVPQASVIVIFHAERFGLAQLHQLRGRVGRGATQSYCVLVGPDNPGLLVDERLKILEQSEDGFLVAEKDLEIRGPGEFLGRKQSGLPGFRVAHILRDVELLEVAREEARKILEDDPTLRKAENQALREGLVYWWKGRLELTQSG